MKRVRVVSGARRTVGASARGCGCGCGCGAARAARATPRGVGAPRATAPWTHACACVARHASALRGKQRSPRKRVDNGRQKTRLLRARGERERVRDRERVCRRGGERRPRSSCSLQRPGCYEKAETHTQAGVAAPAKEEGRRSAPPARAPTARGAARQARHQAGCASSAASSVASSSTILLLLLVLLMPVQRRRRRRRRVLLRPLALQHARLLVRHAVGGRGAQAAAQSGCSAGGL
jgi:hypothetical protein